MFQVFCSHLELLIQQLNAVSEKMELLTEPTVDVDRGKSSLADYQVKAEPLELLHWQQTHSPALKNVTVSVSHRLKAALLKILSVCMLIVNSFLTQRNPSFDELSSSVAIASLFK